MYIIRYIVTTSRDRLSDVVHYITVSRHWYNGHRLTCGRKWPVHYPADRERNRKDGETAAMCEGVEVRPG